VFSVPFEEAKCEQGVKKQVTHKVTLNTAILNLYQFFKYTILSSDDSSIFCDIATRNTIFV
jgi:hypothetical protein